MIQWTEQQLNRLKELAEQGNLDAMVSLGAAYDSGNGLAQDSHKAMELFQKAAEKGSADAMAMIGFAYAQGNGVDKDIQKAHEWLEKAAEKGQASAQYTLGSMLYDEGQDYQKAIYWLDQASRQGVTDAQVILGDCYYMGYGVERNYDIAADWYKKAADQNSAAAQNKLGELYRDGIAFSQDENKAAEWFAKAAEQEYPDAVFNLGLCTVKGKGVPMDTEKGNALIRKASSLGSVMAKMYLKGQEQLNKGIREELQKQEEKKSAPANESSGSSSYEYIAWSDLLIPIGAVIAAFVFTKAVPLYTWTQVNMREINFLLRPLIQLASIVMAAGGAGIAVFLLLMTVSPGLAVVGMILAGFGGLCSIFCYEIPSFVHTAELAAYAVMAGGAVMFVILLLRKLFGRY